MLLTIEKLIYGGDGLSRMPGDEHGRGKSVFVPFVLEGEQVEAEITEQKAGFARARLTRVLEASGERVQPGCPYFGECGGCQYQHTNYENQLRIKEGILRETFRRTAKLDLPAGVQVHASPEWNYRNRTRMRVRTEPDFALGYNRFRSAEVLPVRECPISSPLINRAIRALWELGESGAVPADLREVEWFADDRDERLLVEVTTGAQPGEKGGVSAEWKRFAHGLREALPEMAGVAVFAEARQGSAALRERFRQEQSFGEREILYRTAGGEYRVSAGSFFQTNRFLADELVRVATSGLSGEHALDLYAGVGLFSLALARSFRQVTTVEVAASSFADLKRNVPANVSAHMQSTDIFLKRVPKKAKFDCAVIDPPRAGLGETMARKLGALRIERLVYISCDPATLARDVRVLQEFEYRIEEVHLLDLFPQTFHMETVVRLRR